jgi:hypothetical protein
MKTFSVTFKDPDGVSNSLDEAASDWTRETSGLDQYEMETLSESRREQLAKFAESWIKYQEYITIDFDIETGTATVRKSGRKKSSNNRGFNA